MDNVQHHVWDKAKQMLWSFSFTYVQVCMQMRKLRFLRKIAKIVNCAKKKTNPQLGLAILAKIAIFAIFRKNR